MVLKVALLANQRRFQRFKTPPLSLAKKALQHAARPFL
jgi:hypothetical protein